MKNDELKAECNNTPQAVSLILRSIGTSFEGREFLGLCVIKIFAESNNTEQMKRFIMSYSDMMLYPMAWNWNHLAVLNPKPECFVASLSKDIPVTSDSDEKLPVEYLISVKGLSKPGKQSLKHLLAQINEGNAKPENVLQGLTSLTDVVLENHSDLKESEFVNLMGLFSINGSLVSQDFEESGSLIGTEDGTSYAVVGSSIPAILRQQKKMVNTKSGSSIPIDTKIIGLASSYEVHDKDTLNLLNIFESKASGRLFEQDAVKFWIEYFWKRARRANMFVLLAFSIYAMLFSIFSAMRGADLSKDQETLIVSLITPLAFAFMLMETSQAFADFWGWLSEFWNWIDLISALYPLLVCTILLTGLKNHVEEHTIDIHMCVCILVIYLKWISYLRLIDQTSNPQLPRYLSHTLTLRKVHPDDCRDDQGYDQFHCHRVVHGHGLLVDILPVL